MSAPAEAADIEQLAQTILASTNDAVFVFDPDLDQIIYANTKAGTLLGYEPEELLALPMSAVHPNEMPKLLEFARASFTTEGLVDELTCLTKLGEVLPAEVSASIVQLGDRSCVVESIRDIEYRKKLDEELTHQAFHDPLTGLSNRRLFMDHLTIALARLKRHSSSRVAVLFFDIDRFKWVNDSLGHDAGDKVLVAMAHRITAVLRPSDTASRFGGDEFCVLSEDVHSEQDAITITKRICDAVAVPLDILGQEVRLAASIGIALSTGPDDPPASLVANADSAMYRAKERGKGRYELFDEGMRSRAKERLQSENALRGAIKRDEFVIFYQPEVDIRTGEIVAVEALLRWNHPELGFLLPDAFLPLAEETKLIVPIGSWVLEQACLQAQRWRTRDGGMRSLKLAVNIAASQLDQSGLVDTLGRVLEETGTAPSTLCLEMTESDLVADVDSSINVIEQIRDLGVSFALDDLGKGYASLSLLKRLPIDVVKIDQTFVRGLGQDVADGAIVAAILKMSRALELTAVAEGVETQEQLEHLSEMECDLAQGFYFARPQPIEGVTHLLAAGSLHGGPGLTA
jgi:diguanylate cyclase (GGDEF)-like protein/PAS domain S-box-containing protein